MVLKCLTKKNYEELSPSLLIIIVLRIKNLGLNFQLVKTNPLQKHKQTQCQIIHQRRVSLLASNRLLHNQKPKDKNEFPLNILSFPDKQLYLD